MIDETDPRTRWGCLACKYRQGAKCMLEETPEPCGWCSEWKSAIDVDPPESPPSPATWVGR